MAKDTESKTICEALLDELPRSIGLFQAILSIHDEF
jgi:hypothetical protein